MRFKTDAIDVDVKYKKVKASLLMPTPPIRMRDQNGSLVTKVRVVKDSRFLWKGKELASERKLIDPEAEKQVPSNEAIEILEHFGYKYLNEAGEEIKKDDLIYYAVQEDDSEQAVSPFPRTDVLDIPEENWVPSTAIDYYIFQDNVYELFHPDKKIAIQLYGEAERRLKKDQVGICSFSWGGFTQFYAFVVPMILEGKFVWVMMFTQNKKEYSYWQDIPAKGKLPIREPPPPPKVLPPVQVLVVAAKSKKKKKA